MPLVKQTLTTAILAAIQKQAAKDSQTDTPETSALELAEDIATAVDAYIRTAQVVGTSPSGAVTGNLI